MGPGKPDMQLSRTFTVDSLGACQGISWLHGKAYLYGDREVGMIREFDLRGDSLLFTGHEYKLTMHDRDVINHPTGLAVHGKDPVFMGNSVLLDKATNRWKAVIYCIDWPGLMRTGTLDNGNLLKVIDDDACIHGTRPEYVEYGHKWYVATADYGNKGNEVRLYADVILMLAEVNMYQGNSAQAIAYIDMVRTRAGMPTYETSSTTDPTYMANFPTLKLALLHERRSELAFEHHRWFDLLRFFDISDLVTYMHAKNQANFGLAQLANFSTKDEYYPIPYSEYTINPTKIYQNPGY